MSADIFLLYMTHWGEFALRWLHVITAIAWVGSSFYFIALDLGLRQAPQLPKKAPKKIHGEAWQVHGGGFYHIQKYLVAPPNLPEDLTWFKWESYATWLSGFALMVLVYYGGAELYLIDAEKMALPIWGAVVISLASLGGVWVLYHWLCRVLMARPMLLMLMLYALLVALSWGFYQVFSGRGAFLHLGAVTATIMSANVFFVIIPNQKITVAELKAGRTPDARYGQIAKLRSTHNNYLVLPVLFLMLSGHYPLAFATEYSWLMASLVFLMGVSIRHYFNARHASQGNPLWLWLITLLLFVVIMGLSLLPTIRAGGDGLAAAEFEDVSDIIAGRCSMCHATEPYWEGIAVAPKNVVLETPSQIARYAKDIYLQSAVSDAMPPANITYMEPEERALLRAWFESGGADE